MKKPTIREMRWIDKGFVKTKAYNKIEAKANNALLVTPSDEDFTVKCSIEKTNFKHGFIISLTDDTYFSISINEKLQIVTSINGFLSRVFIDSSPFIISLKNEDFITLKVSRETDNFNFSVLQEKEYIEVATATLPGSKDAISFGFFFKENQFAKIEDFQYIKK